MVFTPPHSSPRGLLHKGENTTRELRALPEFDPQAPESYVRYFDLFYSKVNDTGVKFLEDLTPSDTTMLDVAFRSVGNAFRLIDNQDQRPVFVRFADGEKLIEKLRRIGPNRGLLRKLQRYTVNLHSRVVEKMQDDGLFGRSLAGIFGTSSTFNLQQYDRSGCFSRGVANRRFNRCMSS